MSDVRDFGAVGDGQADDTDALQHAIHDGEGYLTLGRGNYRITRPLVLDLARRGRFGIDGSGGTAKFIMAGAGPALHLIGSHGKSADPNDFAPAVWQQERMPTVAHIEIEGAHPEADGIRIEGVMQPTLLGVLIRRVRTAVHVTKRARNVLISHCHIYHNTGVGVHFDQVNLHQAIITGSHISYCRLGGIRVERCEVRNFQITGNDIEYNNNRAHKVPGADAEPTAEIYIDVGEGTIREGTIVSNTIQATYSPQGANIRFVGAANGLNHKAGLWTIAGNLIGSQHYNVWLTSVRDVTLSGNTLYSGHGRNLLVEQSRNIVVSGNCFGHNPDYQANELCTGIRFVDSVDCNLSGLVIEDCRTGQHTVPPALTLEREGLIEIIRCRRINLSGIHVLNGTPAGIFLADCSDTLLTGCSVLDAREEQLTRWPIRWVGQGAGNYIASCRISGNEETGITAPDHVQCGENCFDR
jgi:hypothetical protein